MIAVLRPEIKFFSSLTDLDCFVSFRVGSKGGLSQGKRWELSSPHLGMAVCDRESVTVRVLLEWVLLEGLVSENPNVSLVQFSYILSGLFFNVYDCSILLPEEGIRLQCRWL